MSLLQAGFGSSGDDYEITDSLRLRSSASAYLSRTPSSTSDRTEWTWSGWVKKGPNAASLGLFSADHAGGSNAYLSLLINNSDEFQIFEYTGSAYTLRLATNAKFRDPSSWYHFVCAVDTDQGTDTNRIKLYVNGVQQTSLRLTTYPSSGHTTYVNVSGNLHAVGATVGATTSPDRYLDGYLTEVNFIDGQQLTPSDFGEYDANGTWKAKDYTGTYGTNGFYLPMKPTTQAELQNTALYTGNDSSQSIDGYGFTPDFVWLKQRSGTDTHALYDTVRGAQKVLYSSATNAEEYFGYNLNSFDSDGFTVGHANLNNENAQTYVAWAWDAGDNQPSTGHSSVLYRASSVNGTYDIKGFGFNPDLLWIKNGNNSERNFLFDTVRGVDSSKALVSNATSAEGTNGISGTSISMIDDGFKIVETSIGSGELYFDSRTYVAWGWDAGDGDPVTNTTGDINSTVKANDATGFSIVSYTGNGTSNSEQTIGHGLSTAPKVVIVKDRTSASTRWSFYSTDLSSDGTYAVKNLLLNTTSAESAYSSQIRGIQGSNTFSVRDVDANGNKNVNKSGDNYIAYCFSEVSGVSKFGSYEGTGTTTGNVVTTGFRPGFVMVKNIDAGSTDWYIWDSTRDPFLSDGDTLRPNLSNAETSGNYIEFTDTGFQLKEVSASYNASGNTYIYMAFKGSYSDHVSPLNDDGSIDSRVKANTSKGFSIVSYEGTGANATVGHGLSAAPEMIIVKNRTGVYHWIIQHASLGPTKYIHFLTDAAATSSAAWNDTAPTSTVFSLGSSSLSNRNANDFIAYCFHSVAGYSKFGTYTGTGSAGKAVTGLGFQPAWLMIKCSSTASTPWVMYDNTREPDNDNNDLVLQADSSSAELDGGGTTRAVTFDSDGFTLDTTYGGNNGSGRTYIYMAFAETRDAQFNFDASGNKNNWLPNNINSNGESETTYDLMKDTPSLVDENAGNFCTMNALNGLGTLSEGNMTVLSTVANWESRGGTVAVSSGKWYWEADVITIGSYMQVGMVGTDVFFQSTDNIQEWATGYGYYGYNGNKANNGSHSSYGATYTTGDLIGIALDLDAGTIEFYKNNVSQGVAFTGLSGEFTPAFSVYGGSGKVTANFGQRPFVYTPPTGFLKLNTFNLPDSTIEKGSDYFTPVLYNGNGGTQAVTGTDFQPDLVWLKSRSNSANHGLHDVLRVIGSAEEILYSNSTGDGNTGGAYLSSFDSNGFTVNNNSSGNASGQTYVAWNWKANGSGVTNNAGANGADIASTYSTNTKAGFSIVTYTGTRTSDGGETGTPTKIYHGLGKKPEMVITKNRTSQSSPVWNVWHKGYQPDTTHLNYQLFLHLTSVSNNAGWQRTDQGFTTNLFCPARYTYDDVNGVDYIAYVFTGIEGYSSFGSYTGNGSTDGPFVYLGFRPKFVMIKLASNQINATSWQIYDTARNTFNVIPTYLFADSSGAESDSASTYFNADILSNGFKLRAANTYGINQSGATYIYMAFAENPFKNSNAR